MGRKEINALLVAMLCLLLLTGCKALHGGEAVPTGQGAPAAALTPAATPLPAPTATLPPGIWEEARFQADLDGDDADETILVYSVESKDDTETYELSLCVLSKTVYKEVFIGKGYFTKAFLMRTPDGQPCTVICISSVEDDLRTTILCSFEALTPELHKGVYGTVCQVDGTNLTLSAWQDFIGSWEYTRKYELIDGFTLVPVSEMTIVTEGREPAYLIAGLPVLMLVNGEYIANTLPAGTLLYFTASDGCSYMDFRLEDGSIGRVTYTWGQITYEWGEESCAMINGISMYEYFDNVEYYG